MNNDRPSKITEEELQKLKSFLYKIDPNNNVFKETNEIIAQKEQTQRLINNINKKNQKEKNIK